MKLSFNLSFFPALREVINSEELEALRQRNEERLAQAKRTDGNVYRMTQAEKEYIRGIQNIPAGEFIEYGYQPHYKSLWGALIGEEYE